MELDLNYSLGSDYIEVTVSGSTSHEHFEFCIKQVAEVVRKSGFNKLLICNESHKKFEDRERILMGELIVKHLSSLTAVAIVYAYTPLNLTFCHIARKNQVNLEMFDDIQQAHGWLTSLKQ